MNFLGCGTVLVCKVQASNENIDTALTEMTEIVLLSCLGQRDAITEIKLVKQQIDCMSLFVELNRYSEKMRKQL